MIVILLAQAITATIIIDVKDSFVVGEKISFNYSISGNNENINYIPYISCSSAPESIREIKIETTPITRVYEYLFITQNIEPQTCNATISIIKPYELTETKTFTILTNPSFDFRILTCKDESCLNQTRVFILGEEIYFDYNSSISNPIITANLTYPNKKIKQLNLPNSIKAEQIGNYELNILASKQDYKTIIKNIQFSVIQKEINISYTLGKDINKELNKTNPKNFLMIGLVIIIAIGISVFLVIIIKKLKKNFTSDKKDN